jgi:hypothetical protein
MSKGRELNNKSNNLIDFVTPTLKKFCASPTENKAEEKFYIAARNLQMIQDILIPSNG